MILMMTVRLDPRTHVILHDVYYIKLFLTYTYMYVFVQTNKATKSVVLNCLDIVVNDVKYKGKDQC